MKKFHESERKKKTVSTRVNEISIIEYSLVDFMPFSFLNITTYQVQSFPLRSLQALAFPLLSVTVKSVQPPPQAQQAWLAVLPKLRYEFPHITHLRLGLEVLSTHQKENSCDGICLEKKIEANYYFFVHQFDSP